MRHQRLRVVATIEFPPGFKDNEARVLTSCKNAVQDAMRAWHDGEFGRCDWPLELRVMTRWTLDNEEAPCASV